MSLLTVTAASAQVVNVPSTPQVGSSNPATAVPPIATPPTKPCVVTLFQNQEFANFNPANFSYTPPAACPGPWAKIVLSADFTVTAGRQFDRTAQFFLGNVNIFYGTTAEPRSALSPAWHVESDLTDYSALFKTAGTGAANIGNVVDSTYTGIIYATAALKFYPALPFVSTPPTPDVVVPINTGNSPATLNATSSVLSQTVTLPPNVERVALDVIAQSQSNDEFWYLCVPSALSNALESCGNTAFRETEVTIDGQPAGVAPVYPWIYTGGLDPYLWEPITGIQTLNFKPYRVDLTPFAGILSNGKPHTVGVSVYNADSYFLVAANLLAYEDHGAKKVTGGLLSNSLSAAPIPVIKNDLITDASGTTTGNLSVSSSRDFKIHGYVNTSHGRVETWVEQSLSFLNSQAEDVNPNTGPDNQYVKQLTTLLARVTTIQGPIRIVHEKMLSYPLTLDYQFLYNADGTYTQNVTAKQEYQLIGGDAFGSLQIPTEYIDEKVDSTDTLQFDTNFNISAAGVGSSHASYLGLSIEDGCFSREIEAVNHVLTKVTTGASCY